MENAARKLTAKGGTEGILGMLGTKVLLRVKRGPILKRGLNEQVVVVSE